MPAIEPPQTVELTDADIDRLDALLRERALPHGGLSLEALDGFFSALIVGPGDMILPSEWMPFVWGENAPEWESGEQAQAALELVMKLWNQIARRVKLDQLDVNVVVPPRLHRRRLLHRRHFRPGHQRLLINQPPARRGERDDHAQRQKRHESRPPAICRGVGHATQCRLRRAACHRLLEASSQAP